MTSSLREKLQEKAYRDAFVTSQIRIALSFQIRALREKRGWTQAELAEKAGMLQPRISAMERPGESKFNLETLLRLASAFDMAFVGRFASFSELVEWAETFSPDSFNVPSFANDPGLPEFDTIKIATSETIHVKEKVFIDVPDSLKQKAMGADRLSRSLDQTEKLREFLRPRKYDNVIPFPIRLPQTTQAEEIGYAAVGNFPR